MWKVFKQPKNAFVIDITVVLMGAEYKKANISKHRVSHSYRQSVKICDVATASKFVLLEFQGYQNSKLGFTVSILAGCFDTLRDYHLGTLFLERNPEIKTKRQYKIDNARINGATTEIISKFFEKLDLPAIKYIKPENRWNMDEAGIMEGQDLNSMVLGSSKRRFIQKKQPGSRTWTSFIECISATGRALLPLVIFKGKTLQQQWFPIKLDNYEGWEFTATDNGWTTDSTGLEWLKEVFIPQSAPTRPKEARLLVLDGLLLENSNQEVVYQNPVSDDDPELQWNIHSSFIAWKTPQKGSDIRKYADIMEKVDETDIPTRRLLFRKIQKGFDAKDYELVQSKKRIKQLEQKLEEIIPKKRRMGIVLKLNSG
ncbi:hypothetical protein SS1G_06625 [Sclerotinia sclerotiorum 1980 UF-70]|uniref:DDE-1 domain-containing protein n=1 Tax=Sclerotinia sclerotiorum (strain ATCC 18683 / 1980 / Ss-1) TaxID=665079 RepID=A7EMS6_SCLS1|nr:hypothetical protein SS1G_06625 [Sclerotinia sclerotiorum 1980 UF-70]EDO04142.1 hypothetical protein SS1G_06625 [Sclerotinia sclerotiorum 1980 UF-70]